MDDQQGIPIDDGMSADSGPAGEKVDATGSISVPQEVRTVTTKCNRDFSCLKNGRTEFLQGCKVQSELGKDLLSVDPSDAVMATCPYLTPFGKAHYCSCPTRYHIFHQYRQ